MRHPVLHTQVYPKDTRLVQASLAVTTEIDASQSYGVAAAVAQSYSHLDSCLPTGEFQLDSITCYFWTLSPHSAHHNVCRGRRLPLKSQMSGMHSDLFSGLSLAIQ